MNFGHRQGFVSILTTLLFLIFWQDRLIALDAAEEFFKIASRTYPELFPYTSSGLMNETVQEMQVS